MFYLIDKTKGISSFKAIKKFSRENNIKKVGHTGTLDPIATGLLLIATDEDTKLIDYVDKGFKKYRATLKLGYVSTTYDIEGHLSKISEKIVSEKEFMNNLISFEGETNQVPPIFSAKKVDGKRAYNLARLGKEIKLRPSKVVMKDFQLISFGEEIIFDVVVSRGTYIRSLIHDLGQKIGVGAYMTDLRRTEIGPLTEKEINKEVNIESLLTIPIIHVDEIQRLKNGLKVPTAAKDGEYAIKYKNDIVGICIVEKGYMKTKKIFGNKIFK